MQQCSGMESSSTAETAQSPAMLKRTANAETLRDRGDTSSEPDSSEVLSKPETMDEALSESEKNEVVSMLGRSGLTTDDSKTLVIREQNGAMSQSDRCSDAETPSESDEPLNGQAGSEWDDAEVRGVPQRVDEDGDGGEGGGGGGQKTLLCHVNTTLMPLKVFNFFFFGAAGSFLPFLAVYLRHLRLSAPETGVIAGLTVILASLLRPVLGLLADLCQARRLLLPLCCALFGAGIFCLWFVPSRSGIAGEASASFLCKAQDNTSQGRPPALTRSTLPAECLLHPHVLDLHTLHLRLHALVESVREHGDRLDEHGDNLGGHGDNPGEYGGSPGRTGDILDARGELLVSVTFVSMTDTPLRGPDAAVPHGEPVPQPRDQVLLLFNENLPRDHVQQNGSLNELSLNCVLTRKGVSVDLDRKFYTTSHLQHVRPASTHRSNAGQQTGGLNEQPVEPSMPLSVWNQTCDPGTTASARNSPAYVPGAISLSTEPSPLNTSQRQHWDYNCTRVSHVTAAVPTSYTFDVTFLLALTLICISRSFYSSMSSLLDAVTYGLLGSNRHLWGRQRLWGTLGTTVVAVVFTATGDRVVGEGFSAIFITCGLLTILSTATSIFFLKSPNTPTTTTTTTTTTTSSRGARSGRSSTTMDVILDSLCGLLRQPVVLIFLLKIVTLGMLCGCAQTFIFWYLRELGSGQRVLGACLLANCVSTVSVLQVSAHLIRRLGERRTMYLALPAYCLRFVSLSVIEEPWLAIPIEMLHGVTYSLLWASASACTQLLAPPSIRTTCQAIAGAVYWDMGRGLGSILTGEMFQALGARWTLRVYGITAALFLPVWGLVDHRWPLPAEPASVGANDTVTKEVQPVQPSPACPVYKKERSHVDEEEGKNTDLSH